MHGKDGMVGSIKPLMPCTWATKVGFPFFQSSVALCSNRSTSSLPFLSLHTAGLYCHSFMQGHSFLSRHHYPSTAFTTNRLFSPIKTSYTSQQPTTTIKMLFSTSAILFTLLTTTLAAPTRRQFDETLETRPYNQWQIADGQAGIALQESEQRFPITDRDPASITDDELLALQRAAGLAAASETGQGGSDERIASAQANNQDTTALENGRTKMRVLQHQLEILVLQVENSRGENNQDQIDEEFDLIRTEIANDEANRGQGSQGISDTFIFGLAEEVSK